MAIAPALGECPKCHYVRRVTDTNPEWQCPSCGIAYAKFGAHLTATAYAHNLHPAGSIQEPVVRESNESILAVYLSKKKLAQMLLICVAFVVVSIGIINDEEDLSGKLAFYICIPVFGLMSAYFLSRLLSTKPALVLDSVGLLDNGSLVSAGLIPWSEITEVQSSFLGNAECLYVYVRDPEKILSRFNPVKRAVMRVNQSMVRTPITISLFGSSSSSQEIVATINRHLASRAFNH
jgi:hypothetical protein